MFCIYCGKEIPDGTMCTCRTNPETAVSAVPADNPVESNAAPAEPPVNPSPAPFQEFNYNNTNYNNGYNNNYYGTPYNGNMAQPEYNTATVQLSDRHNVIKSILGSPLALVTAILYSAGVLAMTLQNFSISVFPVLIIVALWITYSSAHKPYTPLKTSGLSIYSGILIAEIVFLGIGYVALTALLAIFAFIPTQLNEGYADMARYFDINFNLSMPASINLSTGIFIILMVVWTCVCAFSIFFYATLRTSLNSVRSEVNNQPKRHRIMLFPMIMLIVSGVISIAESIFLILTLEEQSEFINSLLEAMFEAYELSGISYTYKASFIGPLGGILTSLAMILSAVLFIKLRSKLKETN